MSDNPVFALDVPAGFANVRPAFLSALRAMLAVRGIAASLLEDAEASAEPAVDSARLLIRQPGGGSSAATESIVALAFIPAPADSLRTSDQWGELVKELVTRLEDVGVIPANVQSVDEQERLVLKRLTDLGYL